MEIIKEVILGYVVVSVDGWVYSEPMTMRWDGTCEDVCLDEEENKTNKVVGVLPSHPNSYVVYGSDDEHPDLIFLGYEYPDAFHPNWEELFSERKNKKSCRNVNNGCDT